MQIIIPMSGSGQRFIRAGYQEIKPLIEVDGRPMISHVLDMFPGEEDVLFICNSMHMANTDLGTVLRKLAPFCRIATILPHKLGPVYTVIKALRLISSNEPLIISYCDYFADFDYAGFKEFVYSSACDGCVSVYGGFHPHLLKNGVYAGVMADNKGILKEIREKYSYTEDKTKSLHSTGMYYFKSGALLNKYSNALLDRGLKTNGEYFVSSAMQLMNEDGLDVRVHTVERFMQWGTPEDLQDYLGWSDYFRRKPENLR